MKTKNGKQLKDIRLDEFCYKLRYQPVFITINADNKKELFLNHKINCFIINVLSKNAEILNCSIPVYCLMPDHLHFVVYGKADEVSITDFVRRFKGYTAKKIKKDFGIFPLWQKRFYDHIIRKNESLNQIAGYIYNNPVRKGLVVKPEQYQWSKILFEDEIFV
ncbi:MAG: REP-associated tyrosine transposase [Candidatus Anammoxibacter sp.]